MINMWLPVDTALYPRWMECSSINSLISDAAWHFLTWYCCVSGLLKCICHTYVRAHTFNNTVNTEHLFFLHIPCKHYIYTYNQCLCALLPCIFKMQTSMKLQSIKFSNILCIHTFYNTAVLNTLIFNHIYPFLPLMLFAKTNVMPQWLHDTQ